MNDKEIVNYSLASDSWGIEEIEAIQSVIKSNRFTMGEKVFNFQDEFAKYFGSKYALMVNSGSSANLLAIASLIYDENSDLNPGDEVIVPAVSWSTTYFPVSQYGLKLRFVDVSLETLNIDVKKIQAAITKRTKAIFAVNLLGNSCNFKKLQQICSDNNLILIEDNCESLGAKYEGKYTGTIGELGTFSFFFSHHMQTMEGGMILTNNERLYQYACSMRAHGWIRDLPDKNHLFNKSGNPFYDSFKFITPGYSIRPLEMSGAIGSVQLKKINKNIKRRRLNANFFKDRFAGLSEDILLQEEIGDSSWFGFSLILKNKLENRRDNLINILAKNSIETRPIVAGDFTQNPVIKYLSHEISGTLSNAKYLDKNGFFVGNDHRNLETKIEKLYLLIKEYSDNI